MTIGEYIKRYRELHQMSQQEFATRSGLSKGYISMLENDRNPNTDRPIKPSIKTFQGVAKVTGTDLDTLLQMLDDDQIVSLETKDESATLETIAAHLDGEELTDEEIDELNNFINYLLSKRK